MIRITVLLGAILLALMMQACDNVSADSAPQMPPNEMITGIIHTDESGFKLGEIGNPSHGGDAEGKQVTCENGPGVAVGSGDPASIPVEFRMGTAYPNPTDGYFVVFYEIPCRMDVSFYLVDPDPKGWGPVPGLMQTSVPSKTGKVVWAHKGTRLTPGIHAVQIPITYDSGINGFFRLYLKADGILAWRDVAIFTDICKAPYGWTITGREC